MGSAAGARDEAPVLKQRIAAPFYMSRFEIANAQYARFIKEGGYQERKWWTAAGWESSRQDTGDIPP